MKYSKYKLEKLELLKRKVFELYKEGYTLREVRDLINRERSRTWILEAVNELEKAEHSQE